MGFWLEEDWPDSAVWPILLALKGLGDGFAGLPLLPPGL